MKKHPLKSRFGLPVVVAVSVHAALLFGFNRPPITVSSGDEVKWKHLDLGPMPVSVDELKPPPENAVGDARPLKTLTSMPTAPDYPMPNDSEIPFRMDPTPAHPGPIDPNVRVITVGDPREWIGDDTGTPGALPSNLLDGTPRVKLQIAPDYPRSLRALGVSGEVLVEFIVDEHGRVINARVLKSSHPDFEAPTLRAVAKWRFDSGKRNGVPVKFRTVAPLNFSISD